MDNSSNTKKWMTCGVVVLLVACIGAVIAFGGLAWFGSLFEESTPQPVADEDLSDNDFPTPGAPQDATSSPAPPSTIDSQIDNATIPFEAVVQIITLYLEDGEYQIGWTGSGTVISPEGLILTNAHVVLPDRYFTVDALVVAFTTREDQEPEALYFAEVIQADASLDIAVIQILRDLDENLIDPADLNLPYVPLGNADHLRLGDTVTILGYPGIGGDTITLTRGEVSGFTSEEGYGDRAFIKTTATIAGGNSGGLAADTDGFLIGIPTQLGYGGDDQFIDCRVLADTNRDGEVDENDSCIPTGGFINALRPINLAYPLIEAAQEGLVHVVAGDESTPSTPSGLPELGKVLFSDDFSINKAHWISTESYGSISYGNEELLFELWEPMYYLPQVAGVDLGDVIIDVDSYVVSPAGDADFGVICRYQDLDNFYGLEVSEDGYYSIWKYVDGEFSYMWEQGWHYLPFELNYQDNVHITAACVGDTLTLAVDGELLAEVVDSDLTSGDVGMIAGTWDVPELIIGFDNLVFSEPKD
jgi:S1-C subfamily serine protease